MSLPRFFGLTIIRALALVTASATMSIAESDPAFFIERGEGQSRNLPLEAVYEQLSAVETLQQTDESILFDPVQSGFDMDECIRQRESTYRLLGDRLALENGFAQQMCATDRRRASKPRDVTPCFNPFTPVNGSGVVQRMTKATRKTSAFFHSMGVPTDQAFDFFEFQLGSYTDLVAARYLNEIGELPASLENIEFDGRGNIIDDEFGQIRAALRYLTVGIPNYMVIVVGLEGFGDEDMRSIRRICSPDELGQ
ncbi:hypothetical protein [Dinoroseobacter shibae]|jgi:hypothetical protein|uniref:hypothetical protein n=2 Tax=Dinoroseobacter shibae TaxID=215813 RepID=UPI0000E99EC1|nr:hypothetical protein [Dinoroseobacter shibae]URF47561.1 hypothetical protein M8008_04530 [Dinoroseobacter shibae]URF51871.1 hypothetical protein M8007_04530 [Dinoroseobacter shibae]